MDLLNKNGLLRTLTDEQEEQFLYDGFVKLENAFPQAIAEEARAILWEESGCDPDNPATWIHPVVRIGDCAQEPFRQAANTSQLQIAFDQLVGSRTLGPENQSGRLSHSFSTPR